MFNGKKGLLEDLAYLPMNWFDGRVSACAISGDKAPGLFLIRRTPSGILIPVLYFAYGSDSKKYLLYMLQYAIQTALQCYPPETPVMILRRTSSIKALSANLFPGHKGDEVFSGIRKE